MLHADHTAFESQPPAHADGARRAEIEDFIQLLEEARARVASGGPFAFALFAARRDTGAAPRARNEAGGVAECHDGDECRSRAGAHGTDALKTDALSTDALAADALAANALKEAYDFLSLNLRRRDSVAFYGPTLLAALLPCGRARRAPDDLARLVAELHDARPHARLAFGLASFPADGADIETLVGRAESALDAALAGGALVVAGDYSGKPVTFELIAPEPDATERDAKSNDDAERVEDERGEDGRRGAGEDGRRGAGDEQSGRSSEEGGRDEDAGGDKRDGRAAGAGDSGGRGAAEPNRPAQEFLPLGESGARSSGEWRVSGQSPGQAGARALSAKRGAAADFPSKRAIRESKHRDDFESAVLPYAGAASNGVLASAAAAAAQRERERRAAGAQMPRRILLAVSDAARMAQINLLLRSAAYEVRAAFDGKQALDLLRIERADLLVLDCALAGVDGLEVLSRLDERHGGRLPLPVVLLVPGERDGEELRERASRLGAGGFVPLPYDPQELLDRVRTAGGGD